MNRPDKGAARQSLWFRAGQQTKDRDMDKDRDMELMPLGFEFQQAYVAGYDQGQERSEETIYGAEQER